MTQLWRTVLKLLALAHHRCLLNRAYAPLPPRSLPLLAAGAGSSSSATISESTCTSSKRPAPTESSRARVGSNRRINYGHSTVTARSQHGHSTVTARDRRGAAAVAPRMLDDHGAERKKRKKRGGSKGERKKDASSLSWRPWRPWCPHHRGTTPRPRQAYYLVHIPERPRASAHRPATGTTRRLAKFL